MVWPLFTSPLSLVMPILRLLKRGGHRSADGKMHMSLCFARATVTTRLSTARRRRGQRHISTCLANSRCILPQQRPRVDLCAAVGVRRTGHARNGRGKSIERVFLFYVSLSLLLSADVRVCIP